MYVLILLMAITYIHILVFYVNRISSAITKKQKKSKKTKSKTKTKY